MSASFLEKLADKTRPKLQAVIREAECIGCLKCIKACPVDAILGGAKQMHTVIAKECTGCELCVAPCPMDCIDMVALPEQTMSEPEREHALKRFYAREKRLGNSLESKSQEAILLDRKTYIQEAIERARQRKMSVPAQRSSTLL